MKNEFSPETLTAYVLGELSEADRRKVDAAAQTDPDLAAELVRLRKTSAYVQKNMGNDPDLQLSSTRRGVLANALARKNAEENPRRWWIARPYVWGPVAGTALVLVVVWQTGIPKTSGVSQEMAKYEMASPPAPSSPPPSAEAPQTPQTRRSEASSSLAKSVGEADAPASPPPARAASEDFAEAPPLARKAAAVLPTVVELRGIQVRIALPPSLGPETERQIATRIAQKIQQGAPYERALAAGGARNSKPAADRSDEREAKIKGPEYMITGNVEMMGEECTVSLSILKLESEEPATERRKSASCSPESILKTFEELAAELAARK